MFSVSSELPSEKNSVEILWCGNTLIPHAAIHEPVFESSKWNTSKSIISNSQILRYH